LDYTSFLLARQLTSSLGQIIVYLAMAVAILLIVFSLVKQLRPYQRATTLGLFLLLLLGFLLLGWYHWKIYQSLVLTNPVTGEEVGRWAIPLWIEDEKLYFWTLLIGLWTVILAYRKRLFQSVLNIVFSGFVITTATTSNPFLSPLPGFATEIQRLSQSLSSSNFNIQMQAFASALGRMRGFYNSSYMWIHPPLLFLAYSTFVVSFLGAVFMIIDRQGGYEKIAYSFAKPGYIVLTIGILLGYPWAIQAWKDQPWWYSPKINVTLMMWVIYTAYLHARLYLHRKRMWSVAATLGILAFVAVIITYITTYIIPGVHSSA
jgi:cytochrome c biogenesis factor